MPRHLSRITDNRPELPAANSRLQSTAHTRTPSASGTKGNVASSDYKHIYGPIGY